MPRSILVALLPILVIVKYLAPLGDDALVWSGTMADRTNSPQAFVIDAFEAHDLAALESDGGVQLVVPRAWLPVGACEGHVLRIAPSGDADHVTLSIEIDEAATEERRAAMRERRDRLPKAPPGDLDL
jgi:hypothetical protein